MRLAEMKTCKKCGKEIPLVQTFCSKSCATSWRNINVPMSEEHKAKCIEALHKAWDACKKNDSHRKHFKRFYDKMKANPEEYEKWKKWRLERRAKYFETHEMIKSPETNARIANTIRDKISRGEWKIPNKHIERVVRKCEICSKKMMVMPHIKTRFCSQACAGKYKMSLWNPMDNEEYRAKAIRNAQIANLGLPNKQELFLWDLVKDYGFNYVGDGMVFIVRKNPDFYNKEQRKIIELAGEYWHTEKDMQERKCHFEKYGFKTLIIWCKELSNVSLLEEKIKEFCNS